MSINITPVARARYALYGVLAVLLSACASGTSPDKAYEVDYGPYPESYQKIVTAYLEANPSWPALDPAKVHFLNRPDQYISRPFGRQDVYGYRVCALVTTADGRDTKANFFLINNNRVVKHLHDTGLVKLPDKF